MSLGKKVWMNAMAALAIATLVAGCSSNAGEVACEDFVRTLGGVAERCGFDRAVNEAAAEDAATRGLGCQAVDRVRDEASFYDECLPFVEALTCAEFDDSSTAFPASCSMQLIQGS